MHYVEKLRFILKVSELTQSALADRLGVSFVSLNSWLHGRAHPRQKALKEIDRLFEELSFNQRDDLEHSLTPDQIQQLIKGIGDAETIDALRDGQFAIISRRIDSIVRLLPSRHNTEAVALLEAAKQKDADVVKDILLYPHVGIWASTCQQALLDDPNSAETQLHLEHFSCIAAVAGALSGVDDFEIEVQVKGNVLVLPSLGRATLLSDLDASSARVKFSNGKLEISTADTTLLLPSDLKSGTYEWEPVHRVTTSSNGLSLNLVIDDIDPYRMLSSSLSYSAPSARLDQLDYKAWKELLVEGWALLTSSHPEYAIGISHGLRMVVPVQDQARHLTAFYRDGFGAIVTTITATPESMAQSMLEEFQRMKIHALHSLIPLYRSENNSGYFAPWAGTPLPIGGLIEGFYSLAGALEMWGEQYRRAFGENQITSAINFCIRRSWEESTFSRLKQLDSLTEFGKKSLVAIHEMASSTHENISAEIHEFTRNLAIDLWICFRMANIESPSEDIERLGQAWLAGAPCHLQPIEQSFHQVQHVYGWKIRRQLGEIRISHPEQFNDMVDNQAYLNIVVPGADTSDALLAAGRYDEAAQAFLEKIATDCEDKEAWVGLTVASMHSGNAISTLGRFPEIIFNVCRYLQIERSTTVDVMNLAKWLEPLLLHMSDFNFDNSPLAIEEIES